MFFSQPPSKLELARRAAADAAKNVAGSAGSLAGSAQSLAGSAGSFIGSAAHSAADSAQSLAQSAAGSAQSLAHTAAGSAQSLAQSAAGSAQSLAQSAGKSASNATEVLSSKAGALLHRGSDSVVETAKVAADVTDAASDSVENARSKAIASQKTAEVSAREAEAAARDAQKRAGAEIVRTNRQFAEKQAEFEAQQKAAEARQKELNDSRIESAREAEEIRLRRSAPVHIDVEQREDEGDFDTVIVKEKSGGFSIWTLLGAVALIAAAIYFLVPKSGRRSRAAIKDRLNKVKGDLVDKTTSAADAASDKTATDLPAKASDTTTAPGATPAPTVTESRTVISDSVEGVAVEGAGTGRIETAGTVAEATDGPQHPNIFDKVAGVVGSAASATEHFAGEAKEEVVQDAKGVVGEVQSEAAKNSKKTN